MEMPTERQEDIATVEEAVEKMEVQKSGAEVNIAMDLMVKELGGESCATHAVSKEYVRLEGATPPELRTNATELANATASGDLTELTSIVNATDTPDVANSIAAQQLEREATTKASREGPLKVLPDQAIDGVSFPGAFGTDLYEQMADTTELQRSRTAADLGYKQ